MSRHASPPAVGPILERADGLEFLGQERGSGYVEPTFLVRRQDGQVLQLSALLYLTLEHLDGRPLPEVAAAVSQQIARELTVEGVAFLVETKLVPLGLVGHEPPPVDRNAAVLTLAGRRTLLPASIVNPVARALRPLFWQVAVVLVIEAVAAGDYWMFGRHDVSGSIRSVLVQPEQLLLVLALMVASMFFHELGHAAGASYGGARPGVVGMGLYIVWPAFYTDVTDAYRLDRRGRLRTDLGGIYFNMVFLVAVLALHMHTGWDFLVVAVILTHLEILQQLLPVVRLDGYFIVGDLVGVPDLFRWVRPILLALVPGRPRSAQLGRLRRWVRWVVAGWVLLVVPVLAVNVWILVSTGPELLSTTASTLNRQSRELSTSLHSYDVVGALVTALSMIALALPLLGLLALGTRLVGRIRGELVRWASRGPHQRAAVTAGVCAVSLAIAWVWLPDPVKVPTAPAAASAALRPTSPDQASSTMSPHPTPRGPHRPRDVPFRPRHRERPVDRASTSPTHVASAATGPSRRRAAPARKPSHTGSPSTSRRTSPTDGSGKSSKPSGSRHPDSGSDSDSDSDSNEPTRSGSSRSSAPKPSRSPAPSSTASEKPASETASETPASETPAATDPPTPSPASSSPSAEPVTAPAPPAAKTSDPATPSTP
jgi:putative peptide zinc metalloprotease protein